MSVIANLFRTHRRAQAADAAGAVPGGATEPADKPKRIPTFDCSSVVFGIDLSADGAATLTVQLYHYDQENDAYYADPAGEVEYPAAGSYLLPVAIYGHDVFLAVTAITGTNAVAQINYSKIRTRYAS